MQSFEVSLKH